MNILIVGLGVIGGSYAKGLKNHYVYGADINPNTLEKAKMEGFIKDGGDVMDFIHLADVVVLSIYPKTVIDFIKKYRNEFKNNAIVTDVTGVKGHFIYEAQNLLPDYVEFVGAHPMAGKEKRGIEYADPNVFLNANFLITKTDKNTEKGIDIVRCLAMELGFGKISIVTPEYHDRVIAFTSQLTHAIAVSLVNSDTDPNTPENTGDSYRDLTRIAKINEDLWSELFLENKKNLLLEMDKFLGEFMNIRSMVQNDDQKGLIEAFKNSTKKRMMFDERNQGRIKK